MAETENPAGSEKKKNKTEKGVKKSEKLVLTPSEEELGIKINQPNL